MRGDQVQVRNHALRERNQAPFGKDNKGVECVRDDGTVVTYWAETWADATVKAHQAGEKF